MNMVSLFCGDRHAARVVRALRVAEGSAGFSQIKRFLEADDGPSPAPSALSKTLRRLIEKEVVAKRDDGRYTLTTKAGPTDLILVIANAALNLEAAG